MAGYSYGILGRDAFGPVMDDGTNIRLPLPPPGPIGAIADVVRQAREKVALEIIKDARTPQEAVAALEAEEREFALISKYQIADRKKNRLSALEKYLDYRAACIGPRSFYQQFAADSDAELSEDIRRMLPPPDRQAAKAEQRDAQAVLYRWIRAAYQHEHGVDFDLPAHLQEVQKNWDRLQVLLKKVKAVYAKGFQQSTAIVLRPKKEDIGGGLMYLLGTYSEHGEGNAVDVEADRNPTLNLALWQFLHDFVGRPKPIDRSKGRWQNDPRSLWADIKGLSDQFAEKTAREIARRKEVVRWAYAIQTELKLQKESAEREGVCRAPETPAFLMKRIPPLPQNQSYWTRPGSTPQATPAKNDPAWAAWDDLPNLEKRFPKGIPASISDAEALDMVFESAAQGNKEKLKGLSRGFFTLDWELVEAFHANGFTWGATFSNQVDLHHFEIAKKVP